MDKRSLLAKLPAFRNNWELVNRKQSVRDIIREILQAHDLFAKEYDRIAFSFYYPDKLNIIKGLWSFCKGNIAYREESEERQTSMNPAGILALSRGDCKHYALFIGGVLDALNRSGIGIDWWYRFAGYKNATMPGHVFVVANIHGREYWIDPVLKAFNFRLVPEIVIDKSVKNISMPLYRVSGVEKNSIGIASLSVSPYKGADNNLNFEGTNNKYANTFSPYLGLSMYRDYGGDRDINEAGVAQALNLEIAKGPSPGHTIPADFVKWVYNTNLRGWNFYYPNGVKPGFTGQGILPADYPKMVITGDGRLTFDRDMKVDDWRNAEIHILTAWAQALINKYDATPYPVKPQHLKEFSQLLYGNVDTRNLFTERRGTSFLTDVGKALEDSVNFVKDKVLTVVGFVPRNAFLGLIGINAFNWAGNLWQNVQGGKWDSIAKVWKQLGGIPEKLYNTIEDGAKKPAILGAAIGADPATDTAALLALAAPIVAALLAFLDKEGKAKEVLSATKSFLQVKYPNVDWSGYDFLDSPGGTPIRWEGDPAYDENLGANNPGNLTNGPLEYLKKNPIVAAGIGAGATYLVTRKQPGQKKFLWPVLIGGAIYFLLSMGNNAGLSKREYLLRWVVSGGDSQESKDEMTKIISSMPESEIEVVYTFVTQYALKNIPVPEGSTLYQQISIISDKYKMFT